MPRRHRRPRSAFTLVELIAVIVVLAVLAGVAIPIYFDWRADAEDSATEGSLGGIRTALVTTFTEHQVTKAPSTDWITDINDVAGAMQEQRLPEGVAIVAGQLVMPNGDKYDFIPQTSSEPARLMFDPPGSGTTSPSIVALLLALLLARRRRRCETTPA